MNIEMRAAAALVAELNYAKVRFTGTDKDYTYFIQPGMEINVGDVVIVPVHILERELNEEMALSGCTEIFKAVEVVKVGKVSTIDTSKLRTTKMVIGVLNMAQYKSSIDAMTMLEDQLIEKKNSATQVSVLAAFGITDVSEIPALEYFNKN